METTKEQRDLFNEIINKITVKKRSINFPDSIFYMVDDLIYIQQDIKTNTFYIRYNDFYSLFFRFTTDGVKIREMIQELLLDYTGLIDCTIKQYGWKKIKWMEEHLKSIKELYLINDLKSHIMYKNGDELLDSIDGILDDIFEEIRKNPSTQPHYQKEIPHIETNKKHINDLKIGDDVVIFIPTVTIYIGKVSFINIEKQFIFVDGDIDDEEGFPKYADKDGYYDVPV